MKKRNIFLTLGLSLALVFGVGVGLSAKSDVGEANAAGETTFYLDCTGFAEFDNEQSICLHAYKSAGDVNTWVEATKAGDNYWSVSVNVTGYTGVEWYRCETGNTGNHYNKQSWQGFGGTILTYYRVTGWDNPGDNKQWSNLNSSWTVVGATSGTWTSQTEDISIALSSSKFSGSGFQYYSTTVSLTEDSVFKIKNSANDYYGFDKLGSYNNQSANEKGLIVNAGEPDKNILVKTSGTYEVYVNAYNGDLWIQAASDAEILDFSTRFLAAMGPKCTDEDADNKTAVQSIWTTWKGEFEGLTEGARSLFGTSSNATVTRARTLYSHVVKRYGLAAWTDAPKVVRFVSPIDTIFGESSSEPVIILVVISLVSVSAVAGVYFIRKRKHN